MTIGKLTEGERALLAYGGGHTETGAKALRIIDGLTAKCDAQAAVIVRERLGWLLKRVQCDGFVTVSELSEEIEALSAAPEQMAPDPKCDEQVCRCGAWRDLHQQRNDACQALIAANARVAELTVHAEYHRTEEPHALEEALRRCTDLESQCRALSEDRDAANARADAAERAHYAEAEALGRVSAEAAALRAERDAALARVAELERSLESQQALVEREEHTARELRVAQSQLKQEQERFAAMVLEYGNLADAANARADAAELAHEYQRKLTVEADGRTNDALTEVASLKMQLEACRGVAESEAAALRAEVERLRDTDQRRSDEMLIAAEDQRQLMRQLAAANALLESLRWEPDVPAHQKAAIVAHLSGQAPAQSEAMRELAAANALLREGASIATRYVPEWRERVCAHLSGQAPARSEAVERGKDLEAMGAAAVTALVFDERTDHERAVLEACRELTEEQILQIHSIDSELGNALLARREAEKA